MRLYKFWGHRKSFSAFKILGYLAASKEPLTSRLTIGAICPFVSASSVKSLAAIAASVVLASGVQPDWF